MISKKMETILNDNQRYINNLTTLRNMIDQLKENPTDVNQELVKIYNDAFKATQKASNRSMNELENEIVEMTLQKNYRYQEINPQNILLATEKSILYKLTEEGKNGENRGTAFWINKGYLRNIQDYLVLNYYPDWIIDLKQYEIKGDRINTYNTSQSIDVNKIVRVIQQNNKAEKNKSMSRSYNELLTTKEGLQELGEWEKYHHDELTSNNTINGRDTNYNGVEDLKESPSIKEYVRDAQSSFEKNKHSRIIPAKEVEIIR